MAEEREGFIPIDTSFRIPEDLTSKQEAAVRMYAGREGYQDLRGFHWYLRREQWDYYDVLKEIYR